MIPRQAQRQDASRREYSVTDHAHRMHRSTSSGVQARAIAPLARRQSEMGNPLRQIALAASEAEDRTHGKHR
jgi:hypothetical protein